jgi:hypothetical protein
MGCTSRQNIVRTRPPRLTLGREPQPTPQNTKCQPMSASGNCLDQGSTECAFTCAADARRERGPRFVRSGDAILVDPLPSEGNPLAGLVRPIGPQGYEAVLVHKLAPFNESDFRMIFDLAAARDRRGADAPARCECGSEWFRLDGGTAAPEGAANGAITMAGDGRLTGYMGEPRCVECGARWDG